MSRAYNPSSIGVNLMNNRNKKLFFLLVGIVAIVAIALYVVWQFYANSRHVTITYNNISSVRLVEIEHEREVGEVSGVGAISSGSTITIDKHKQYVLNYTGNKGYESGQVPINEDDTEVTINPDYSKDNKKSLIDERKPMLDEVIRNGFADYELYNIERGVLYNKDSWYFTKLTYKDTEDEINSDTLIVGLQKEPSGSYKMILKPYVYFSKLMYPNVADDVLDIANRYAVGLDGELEE